jgi:acylphosphatase
VDAGLIRRRVVVRGTVQGVGFRYSLARRAESAGVAGWVRNLPDGAVEAVLEGPAAAVDQLVRWCEGGPRLAEVTGVDVVEEEPEGLRRFEIRH